jgi:hypothetical protein
MLFAQLFVPSTPPLVMPLLKPRRLACAAFTLVLLTTTTFAQSTPVNRIRESPATFRNEIVNIEGKVTRHVDEGRTSYPFYLEDNFGSSIRVVGTTPQPPVDSRWQVTGLVALDAAGDPYVIEQRRAPSAGAAPTAGSGGNVDSPPPPPDSDSDGVTDAMDRCPATPVGGPVDSAGCEIKDRTLLYVGGGMGALLVLGGLAWYVTSSRKEAERQRQEEAQKRREDEERRKREEDDRNKKSPSTPSGASGDDTYDGVTMRFTRPIDTDGTIKLLPGRLQVIAGADKGQEIRLVKSGGGTPEITFGRSEGARFTHIQLRAPTVSRRHALMRLDQSGWVIANFSETNPVVLNGTAMNAVGTPSQLRDGDTFELGEVGFRFIAK